MTRTIAVTGATGFVGRHLVRALIAKGYRVRALTRRPQERDPEDSASPTWIAGDLENENALARLLEGADAVIHCAALVKALSKRDFHAANEDGVARLAAVASRRGGARFVLVSSLAAREPHLSSYASSKRAGEAALARHGDTLDWSALRPPAVYGPEDREILRLFKTVRRGVAPLPGGGRGRLSLIHVEDLADAIVALLEARGVEGRVFEVDDGAEGGYSWRWIYETAARHLGIEVAFLPVPRPLLALGAHGVASLAALRRKPAMLTPEKVREIYHPDWVADGRALASATGWRPRIGAEEGLRTTLEWYKAQRLL